MTTTRPRPDACLVRLAGEVDLDTAPILGAYLRTHTAANPGYLLLDLREVNLLAAAGLTIIVAAQREDQSIHGDLRVIGVPSNRAVARVLRITGIDTSLRIHPTVADALDAIDTIIQNYPGAIVVVAPLRAWRGRPQGKSMIMPTR